MADDQTPGCLEGCDRTPRVPEAMPTAGQLLHSLHTKSREDQIDMTQRMLDASDSAVRCFTRDHEGRLARDDYERSVLLWLHAEAAWKRDRAESSRQAWAEEAMRLDVELGEALAGEARARQECNEAYELIHVQKAEIDGYRQAYDRTFARLQDVEAPVHPEGEAP